MAGDDETQNRLFDAAAIAGGRGRAMARGFLGGADVVHREAAARLADRLGDVTRRFEAAVVAGTGAGAVDIALRAALRPGAPVTMTDPSSAMLAAAVAGRPGASAAAWTGETLPFARGEADLALSFGLMHLVEDPVGHLIQLRLALRPDGLMLAVFPGGETLMALRQALAEAEVAETGGISPRIAPMADLRAAGALLQRAGFAMPVADREVLSLSYADAFALMRDLRAMGESAVLADRLRRPTRRAVLARAAALYAARMGTPDGRVAATVELIVLTGWAPGPDQPQPKRPGSAKASLAEALGTVERSAGERAGGERAGG
ncbi:MAG: methyltransferase domain-containing protein [Pseudomonadota bacterium]